MGPLRIFSTLFVATILQGVVHSVADPCSPSPCGPNTECSRSISGAAVCRCARGFFPKPNTIVGCGPQCYYDSECPSSHRCLGTKCVASCSPSPCGYRANCQIRNHRAICACPTGYSGDPYTSCRPEPQVITNNYYPDSSILVSRISNDDPCQPNPCGINAQCRQAAGRPVCSCLSGHQGDPYTNCRRGECQDHSDCPSNRACKDYNCVSPCTGVCGTNADCDVRDHVAVCRCPSGYVGDPFRSCRRFDPNELCHPSPCGPNTNCRVDVDKPVCSCLPGYQGNPISGCRHECESDAECSFSQACVDFKCRNPCSEACGENANCDVQNHRAVCSCPKDYIGNPYSRCYPECTQHSDCQASRACFAFKCTDPCVNACGVGAECRVQNHKAICSCPKGYTGHPFDRCRPFEKQDLCVPNPCGHNAQCRPGHDNTGKERPVCTCLSGYVGDPLSGCVRGECERDSDCPASRACINNECRNPCGSACGTGARCEVRNHGAVCSCPAGYTGDPLLNCYPDERYKGRRLFY